MSNPARDSPELIVYVDRSDVRPGTIDKLRTGIRDLVTFVEAHEPRLITYGFWFNQEADQMTVIAAHPDSASLEFHLDVARGEFAKLADLITLREITVYGVLSERALGLLCQKAAALGEAARISVHAPEAAFVRAGSARD